MTPAECDGPDDQGDTERGIECSGCGCRHFHVLYTRPAPGGRIQRRRECRNCGQRLTTVEHVVGPGTGSP